MLRFKFFVLLALAASGVHAEEDPFADLKKGQPKEVGAVAERIAVCNHFAGEEPYDAERRQEIADAMKKYRCGKLERDEAGLRKRYKDNPGVLEALQKAHDW